jgi:hypothetical protein
MASFLFCTFAVHVVVVVVIELFQGRQGRRFDVGHGDIQPLRRQQNYECKVLDSSPYTSVHTQRKPFRQIRQRTRKIEAFHLLL